MYQDYHKLSKNIIKLQKIENSLARVVFQITHHKSSQSLWKSGLAADQSKVSLMSDRYLQIGSSLLNEIFYNNYQNNNYLSQVPNAESRATNNVRGPYCSTFVCFHHVLLRSFITLYHQNTWIRCAVTEIYNRHTAI